ncbi:hypothetical protein D3C78_1294480 [compost metagenome]
MVGGQQHRLVAGDVGLRGQHVEALRARGARRRFEGEGGDAVFGQARQVGAVERVEHADQHGAGLHQRQLGGAGRGDLEHQGGAQRGGGIAQLGTGSRVGGIRNAGLDAGTVLHDDLMALGEELLHRFRRGGHAGFAGNGFEGYTNLHGQISLGDSAVHESAGLPEQAKPCDGSILQNAHADRQRTDSDSIPNCNPTLAKRPTQPTGKSYVSGGLPGETPAPRTSGTGG